MSRVHAYVLLRQSSVLAALLGLSVLWACSRPEQPSPVRIAVNVGPVTLDPHAHNDMNTFSILRNVFDSLVDFDEHFQIQPQLADSWSNPDDATWLFHLRGDVRFANGNRLTAGDVVYSLERARSAPESLVSGYLAEVASVSANSSSEVVVKTRRASPALLNRLVFVLIMPRGSAGASASVSGSGPYRIDAWKKGEPFWLEPVPSHWKWTASIPRVQILPIPSSEERTARLLGGDVDIVQDLPAEDFERVGKRPGFRTASMSSSTVEYLHLSTKDPRFKDRRVREAISLALDREELVRQIAAGHGDPASQLVGPGVFGFDPSLRVEKRNIARARELLRQAGLPNGLSLTLEFRYGRSGDEIARQLAEAGITVTPKAYPWSEIFARLVRHEVPFYLGGISAPTVDAGDILDSFVHTPSGIYGRSNFNDYSNPHLDKTILSLGSVGDISQRGELLQSAMRTIVTDLYHIPLYLPHSLYGMKKDIGFEPRLDRTLAAWTVKRN